MCGIFLCLDRSNVQPVTTAIKDLLRHRGPDSQRHISFRLIRHESNDTLEQGWDSANHGSVHVSCVSSVLSLRGDRIVAQPITKEVDDLSLGKSSFLCWNGEAWSFGGAAIRGNDSSHVFNTLCHIAKICRDSSCEFPQVALAEAIAAHTGPFAFVFYDHLSHRLYCGRDFLGRRSLLYKRGLDGSLYISSVPDDRDGWQEFEADGLYYVDLDLSGASSNFDLQRTPYKCCDEQYASLRYTQIGTSSKEARLAVLFSGGIDCTILARLSHDILDADESIDLLNVAFENPRVHGRAVSSGRSPYEQCPDRKTAESSLKQLQAACPNRVWRLVRINVPYTEFVAHRESIIDLIYPHNTEMDLSIAAALYFAARGQGLAEDQSLYKTPARVLLSGLGADELFGGYTRHATAYNRGGLSALQEELALDISRLGKRNLGRDDRVISHWAKEARYPFLDEYLVNWALSASLWEKCGFGQPCPMDDSGTELDPAKMLLRCLALRAGLGSVSNEKKRAIQFGARTAKMEVRKTKGTQLLTKSQE
ncbi:hypothetical protein K461DRAFT_284707 [Myriangium duriaei CBS 260.36]|uniref:Asparagine synthetase domain-containing protein n=1 Tax=Myriangium duriaei CBS 260.36 TaxID=1168546 RepID=A0A9P4MQY5_9PEZI|nr:hypothetical protein K461DRAFT_284707 [Myriangium duriaei CBS 260.36]